IFSYRRDGEISQIGSFPVGNPTEYSRYQGSLLRQFPPVSSNPQVTNLCRRKSVKRTSLVLVLSGLILLMGCGGGGNSGSSNPPSPAATLTSLQVTPASQSLAPGAGQQFTATGHYSDGTSKDITSSAQWSSSDSNVASVSGTGMATAVAFGVVTVTAQSGSLQATATVNVSSAGTNLTAISISPAGASIPIHTTQQFTATGSYSDGSSRDLTGLVSWGSSSTAAATIDVNGLLTG